MGAYDLIRRTRPGRTYLVASPTYTILEDTTFPTFKALAQDLGVWDSVKLTPRPNVKLINGATVRFRSAENPELMRGPNLSDAWLDEGSLMSRDAFNIVVACLREGGEQGGLSATFTPKGLAHWTYEIFGTNRPNTALFHAATRDNPFNASTFAATLGEIYTGAFAKQELEGEFVDEDESFQVIPTAWVRDAMERWQPSPPCPLSSLGADIARGGADSTQLSPRHGHWFAPLIGYSGSETPDGPTAAMKIYDAVRSRGNMKAIVNIDGIGVGASAFDACVRQGLNAASINFGSGTAATDRTGILTFRNMRAFAYWSLRELLEPSNGYAVQLPPDDDLRAELIAHRWKSVGGSVQIEPKDQIKQRLGRSPDKADALALSILLPPEVGGQAETWQVRS